MPCIGSPPFPLQLAYSPQGEFPQVGTPDLHVCTYIPILISKTLLELYATSATDLKSRTAITIRYRYRMLVPYAVWYRRYRVLLIPSGIGIGTWPAQYQEAVHCVTSNSTALLQLAVIMCRKRPAAVCCGDPARMLRLLQLSGAALSPAITGSAHAQVHSKVAPMTLPGPPFC